MPTLTGVQAESLWKALLDAFDLDELRRLLSFALGKRLDNITLGGSYETRVFDVIENAEREGWVLRLISAACDARLDSGALRSVAAVVGLTAAPASLTEARVAGASLERIILDSPFHDISAWRVRLGELEGRVCRVEFPEGTARGTGFLVAPDLVLTNQHVIAALADDTAAPEAARLRFDYKRAVDEVQVFAGTVFRLAHDWLVASRPYSAVDELASPGDLLPAADELDFALLRVREAPGEQPIGLAAGLLGAPQRGWIRASQLGADGFAGAGRQASRFPIPSLSTGGLPRWICRCCHSS